ncbi:hypothetical protein DL769_001420 [Monosporascus sp. CRB-8-3]|nr:hypothetical protein DL769_001420 [Monosporascus sp. CRB-8-3]
MLTLAGIGALSESQGAAGQRPPPMDFLRVEWWGENNNSNHGKRILLGMNRANLAIGEKGILTSFPLQRPGPR